MSQQQQSSRAHSRARGAALVPELAPEKNQPWCCLILGNVNSDFARQPTRAARVHDCSKFLLTRGESLYFADVANLIAVAGRFACTRGRERPLQIQLLEGRARLGSAASRACCDTKKRRRSKKRRTQGTYAQARRTARDSVHIAKHPKYEPPSRRRRRSPAQHVARSWRRTAKAWAES